MAKASRKHMGPGSQGKGDGSGGASPVDVDIPENSVLTNRDKALHPEQRGQDSKWVQVEQEADSELNQQKD